MKKITSYQTTDGKTYTDKKAAHLHEIMLTAKAKIIADWEAIFAVAPTPSGYSWSCWANHRRSSTP